MTARTSEDLRAGIERLNDRVAELVDQHATTDEKLTSAREQYARAIADGADEAQTAAARDQARELVEELIGIDNAIPLLEAERDAAEVELDDALAREAEERAEVALEASGEAARALAEYLAHVVGDENLGALCEATLAALMASIDADREAGLSTAGSPPRCLRAWQEFGFAPRASTDLRDTLPRMLLALREERVEAVEA